MINSLTSLSDVRSSVRAAFWDRDDVAPPSCNESKMHTYMYAEKFLITALRHRHLRRALTRRSRRHLRRRDLPYDLPWSMVARLTAALGLLLLSADPHAPPSDSECSGSTIETSSTLVN